MGSDIRRRPAARPRVVNVNVDADAGVGRGLGAAREIADGLGSPR
jgi:hypothetical protein